MRSRLLESQIHLHSSVSQMLLSAMKLAEIAKDM